MLLDPVLDMGGTGQRESSERCTGLLNGEACGEVVGVITVGASFGPNVGKDMDPGQQTRTGAGAGIEELLSMAVGPEPIEKSAGTAEDANDDANSQTQTPPLWERQPQSSMLGQARTQSDEKSNQK